MFLMGKVVLGDQEGGRGIHGNAGLGDGVETHVGHVDLLVSFILGGRDDDEDGPSQSI